MKTLKQMLYESLNTSKVNESRIDRQVIQIYTQGMDDGWFNFKGRDWAFSEEDKYNLAADLSHSDVDKLIKQLEREGHTFKFKTRKEADQFFHGRCELIDESLLCESRIDRHVIQFYTFGMDNGFVDFKGRSYAFSEEDKYNLAADLSHSDVDKLIKQLEREGHTFKFKTRKEAKDFTHFDLIGESLISEFCNCGKGKGKGNGVGTFKLENEEEECERCKAIRGGAESEEEEEENASKSIKNKEDFKSYAEKKFKVVFGDKLDKDKMNKTIDGILNDNSKAVDDSDWGKLIGILNKSFGA